MAFPALMHYIHFSLLFGLEAYLYGRLSLSDMVLIAVECQVRFCLVCVSTGWSSPYSVGVPSVVK